jgi:hypothetical protein
MRSLLTGATCVASSLCFLAGCAGVRTDVQSSQPPENLELRHSYSIARSPVQDDSPAQSHYEELIRGELGRNGLIDAAADRATYLLSISYDTRPASVLTGPDECNGTPCRQAGTTRLLSFGRTWRHSLTLRFFDPASGDEAYRVSATSRDGDADPQHAVPYLVKSALAKLPFAQHAHWRVKLKPGEAAADEPKLLSVEPVTP